VRVGAGVLSDPFQPVVTSTDVFTYFDAWMHFSSSYERSLEPGLTVLYNDNAITADGRLPPGSLVELRGNRKNPARDRCLRHRSRAGRAFEAGTGLAPHEGSNLFEIVI